MAVGVIIGGAFGKIVTSLVNDIMMPIISKITGGINFTDLKIVLTPADEAKKVAEVAFAYGNFIQNVFDFLIIALCIFAMVKAINSLKKKEEEKPEEPPKPSNGQPIQVPAAKHSDAKSPCKNPRQSHWNKPITDKKAWT